MGEFSFALQILNCQRHSLLITNSISCLFLDFLLRIKVYAPRRLNNMLTESTVYITVFIIYSELSKMHLFCQKLNISKYAFLVLLIKEIGFCPNYA